MGATAVLVGFRHKIERKPVQGQADECLVADVRAGDDTAFEAIYDRYARGVLAFCVHMLGSYEAAEDALQLTFVSAYRALRTGDREISLRPWLYTIARNRCLSELRSRRDADDIDGMAIDRPLPDGLADQVQRREELREMVEDMQRLPADQRAALVLFELGDHSHNEIAAVLGVRREKVKALIFQAREGLVRGRHARNRPCPEIREQLATLEEKVLPRSVTRAHIDRCPSCAAFEHEVHRQRAALAMILPVIPAGELKATVLGAALGGGGVAAVGVGGTGAIVTGGTTAAGAGTAAAGNAGAIAVGGGATGSLVSGGAGAAGTAGTAVVAAAPVSAVATGLTAVGADYAVGGIGGIGAGGVVAKILTAAVIATGAVGAGHVGAPMPQAASTSASVLAVQIPSATPATPAPILTSANLGTPAGTPTPDATATNTLPVLAPGSAGTPMTIVAIVPSSTGSFAGMSTLTATTASSNTDGPSISQSTTITSSLSTPINGHATATNDQSSSRSTVSSGPSTAADSGAPSPTPPPSEPGAGSADQTAAGSPVATDTTIVNQATADASTPNPTPDASTAAPTDSGGATAATDAAASFSTPPDSGGATATPTDASAITSASPEVMSADVPVNADSPSASSSSARARW